VHLLWFTKVSYGFQEGIGVKDLGVEYEHILKVEEKYIDIMIERTNLSKRQIKKFMKQNTYFDMEEALKYEIINEIIEEI